MKFKLKIDFNYIYQFLGLTCDGMQLSHVKLYAHVFELNNLKALLRTLCGFGL